MNRAMFAAASGMAAQQTQLEIVADNLANADVAGFKGASATFADVRAGALGLGTTSVGKHAVFAQGKLVRSGGPFDLAIDGPGFFAVERHGARGYTRNGEFARDADGTLRNSAGWALSGVRIPAGALAARVERDGRVVIDTAAAKGRTVAHLRLAAFASPEALRPLGATLFAATEGSGRARLFAPGAHDGPSIAFGMLERSNVSIIDAMMQILGAQRAVPRNSTRRCRQRELPQNEEAVPQNASTGGTLQAFCSDLSRACQLRRAESSFCHVCRAAESDVPAYRRTALYRLILISVIGADSVRNIRNLRRERRD